MKNFLGLNCFKINDAIQDGIEAYHRSAGYTLKNDSQTKLEPNKKHLSKIKKFTVLVTPAFTFLSKWKL
jgi:hypothetical protein